MERESFQNFESPSLVTIDNYWLPLENTHLVWVNKKIGTRKAATFLMSHVSEIPHTLLITYFLRRFLVWGEELLHCLSGRTNSYKGEKQSYLESAIKHLSSVEFIAFHQVKVFWLFFGLILLNYEILILESLASYDRS